MLGVYKGEPKWQEAQHERRSKLEKNPFAIALKGTKVVHPYKLWLKAVKLHMEKILTVCRPFEICTLCAGKAVGAIPFLYIGSSNAT